MELCFCLVLPPVRCPLYVVPHTRYFKQLVDLIDPLLACLHMYIVLLTVFVTWLPAETLMVELSALAVLRKEIFAKYLT